MAFHYPILNAEFRDQVALDEYPLVDGSPMGNDKFRFERALLLDAVIVAPPDSEAPFHISMVRGLPGGSLEIRIQDFYQNEVASGTLSPSADRCHLSDPYGLSAGTLVYGVEALARQAGELLGRRAEYGPFDAVLDAGVCFVAPETPSRAMTLAGSSAPAAFKAGRCVAFAQTSGVVRVNLYGEEFPDPNPVKTVNNLASSHVWLCAHPSSNVRVVTRDGQITVALKKDMTNG